MNLRNSEIWTLIPNIVMLNHCRSIYDSLMRDLIECKINYGILDTEGGVFSQLSTKGKSNADDLELPFDSYALTLTTRKSLRDRATLVCCWNDSFRRFAIANRWFNAQQLVTTGPARADFYSDPWRKVMLANSTYVDRVVKPMVMLNASFPLANPRFQSPENEARQLATNYAMTSDQVQKLVCGQIESMNSFVQLVARLSESMPGVNFIYRPHPFENEDYYRETLPKRDNILLNREGTVDGWLARSKAVVHCGCSTAIDAALLGIPAFHPLWATENNMPPLVSRVSIPCRTEIELIGRLHRAIENMFHHDHRKHEEIGKAIADSYYKIDGKAAQRIADAIMDRIHNGIESPDIHKCRSCYIKLSKNLALRQWYAKLAQKILLSVNNFILPDSKQRRFDFAWDNSPKYFDAYQVNSLLSLINKTNPDGTSVAARPASANKDYAFEIEHPRSIVLYRLQEKKRNSKL
jgi:surface carbohydrate biosynthesis protein